ncbi:hypothetical protein ACWXVL_00055 [Mycoplasma sp. 128]
MKKNSSNNVSEVNTKKSPKQTLKLILSILLPLFVVVVFIALLSFLPNANS